MQPIAYKTDKMSWTFILSALRRIQADEVREPSVDLNLEASSCIVMSCLAIEAYVNEVSSLTAVFLHKQKQDQLLHNFNSTLMEDKIFHQTLKDVTNIRLNRQGSFYDRFKQLLCYFNIQMPNWLEDLSSIGKVRDAFVHFRECDVPIIVDESNVIKEGQELPSDLKKLQNRKYHGKQLFAPPEGSPWTLRLATDAMAAWSLSLCINAIEYILNELPNDRYKNFVWKAYSCRDPNFDTLFAWGKNILTVWWESLADAETSNR